MYIGVYAGLVLQDFPSQRDCSVCTRARNRRMMSRWMDGRSMQGLGARLIYRLESSIGNTGQCLRRNRIRLFFIDSFLLQSSTRVTRHPIHFHPKWL